MFILYKKIETNAIKSLTKILNKNKKTDNCQSLNEVYLMERITSTREI